MAATKTKQKGKKVTKRKRPVGRPSSVTEANKKKICTEVATTQKSLRTICKELKINVASVLNVLHDNEDFRTRYTRAKEEQADLLTEQMLEIADDSSNDTTIGEFGPMENREWINRSKLRVETRKWIASKLKPKKYGDKLDVEHSGNLAIQWQEQKTYEANPKADEGA